MRKLLTFVAAVAVCFAPGAVGSIFTTPAIPVWYAGLVKPSFSPPNWIFGPAWTLLYLLMGIALFLVIKDGLTSRRVTVAAGVFVIQLFLNGLWSYVFFGLQSPGWALVEISVLWACILVSLVLFMRISKTAGLLLVPYLGWVTFAAALNAALWRLNG